jgi:Zn-dependent protease with chaperone function
MNFFDHQERARSHTKRLVVLFVLAVLLTILAIYVSVAGFLLLSCLAAEVIAPAGQEFWFIKLAMRFASGGLWNWELLGWVTAGVLTVLLMGSSYKLWQLSRGGAAVAELLGGRLHDLNSTDLDEQRLRNVVEEMAIAAGLPVPDIYILEAENGINAFAAGNDSSDAVIGVTFGALKLLSRDELQGVIAHEFSHILNGDMSLNMRLIGWLHGILGLVVLGRVLTLLTFGRRSQSRAGSAERDKTGIEPIFHPAFLPFFVLGCICIVAGSFGAFFARWIKSAVNRQREYLADAAAVQFTRNPAGVAGALIKIGGLRWHSLMAAARAEEASHMYFGNGMRRRWFGFTSTHPPLTERIQRIEPHFDGKYPEVSLERVLRESKVTAAYREHGRPLDFDKLVATIGPAAAAQEMLHAHAARDLNMSHSVPRTEIVPRVGAVSTAHLEYAALFLRAMPEALRAATSQPFSAMAQVYGMICSNEPETRARQLAELAETTEPGIVSEVSRLLPMLDGLEEGAFLPLADLCMPALRQLSETQYEIFRSNLQLLVEHDRQIDVFEYMLERMIIRHLDPYFRQVRRPIIQYYALKPLIPDCGVLLSGLARIAHDSEEEALAAFQAGAAQLSSDSDLHLVPFAECNLPQIDTAINKAAQASPRLKQQVLNALAAVVATDGLVKRREAELLRAIAEAFGAPIPPFLRASNDVAH